MTNIKSSCWDVAALMSVSTLTLLKREGKKKKKKVLWYQHLGKYGEGAEKF